MRALPIVALLALVAVPLVGAGEDAPDVRISNFRFVDATTGGPFTIALGESVTWYNADGSHTATSIDLAFNSDRLLPGESYTWTPTLPGVFQYACTFHVSMQAVLVVA